MARIICQFSCGAASAVATKLALAQYEKVEIVNAFIAEEHPDNRRFLADCERWFGQTITVLRNEKYGASTHEVWRRERYMKGRNGASCARALKRRVLDQFAHPDDVMVIGFTAEERERFDDLKERIPTVIAPLIDRGLGKADCLSIIERAGIELPAMYKLGYNNANCIGCIKGGEGYWNKIRRDFPETFEQVATIENWLGPGAYLFLDRATKRRYSLRELKPDAGRHNETLPGCSFFCELAESEIAEAEGN